MEAGRVPGSKDEVRELLARLGLHAHKRFGQNFLADRGTLERIVERSGAGPSSVVLEVGPGLGTLTEKLLATGAAVVAVEIDHGLARHLRSAFEGSLGLVLLERDVMGQKGRIAPEVAEALAAATTRRGAAGFDVVSNLPYGISSPFLGSLAFPPGPPRAATVMLQHEFARVLAARPGTENYSSLSVFVQTFFAVRRELDVGRHAFFPVPDVDSAVVSLVPAASALPEPESFSRFVQTLFQSRRKAIATSLRPMLAPRDAVAARAWVSAAGLDPDARIEAIDPARIVDLFHKVGWDRGRGGRG